MNMKVLKKSRKKLQVGDIFVYQMKKGEYGYGRVIRLDAHIGGFSNVIMIYIYNAFSTDKHRVPILSKDNLLIPPIGTNRQPWLRGYFKNICNKPLAKADILAHHCFKDIRGLYFDDEGNMLSKPTKPCGEYGLHSYRTIDDAISEALGIPLAPRASAHSWAM